jgi:hypothetical protein
MNTIPHGPLESFVKKGLSAQQAVDIALEEADAKLRIKSKVADKLGVPTLSPGHVQRQLRIMDETLLSIRDAAKCSHITGSKAELQRLADDVESHARRVIQLALEIREGAR